MDRDRLVVDHLDLARGVARRFAGRGEPLEDLEQVAREALVRAAGRWDPDRGTSFPAFAVPTVLGELKRHFRDRTWRVSVPRSAKELLPRIREAAAALAEEAARAGRPPPTAADVAARAGADTDAVLLALEAGAAYRPDPLGAEREGAVDDPAEQVVDRARVADLLATLDERDRRIVVLAVVADWTQERIAAREGLSQEQVSRVLRRSLRSMGGSGADPDRGR